MTNSELGAYLARQIFDVGGLENDKAQRIEFKGGTYPDHETALGGLCESSLAEVIAYALDRRDSRAGGKHGD